MTPTEIIAVIEENEDCLLHGAFTAQSSAHHLNKDLYKALKHLALHVQQLELEVKKLKSEKEEK